MGNALATYGRVSTGIGAVVATFVSIIFIGVGMWLIFKKNEYTGRTTAVVEKASCLPVKSGYNCNATVQYTVDNKKYVRDIYIAEGKQSLKNGDIVKVDYNPSNPGQVESEPGISLRTIGFISSFLGIAILVISWLTFYFTGKSKTFAQMEGASNLFNLF